MKTRFSRFALMAALQIPSALLWGQPLTRHSFWVVNMIPNSQSNETNFDSETNIAVNPANPQIIAGSAFTFDPGGGTALAPVFVSADGGTTWALNNIVPSGNGVTGDISLGFAAASNNLYAGILRGGSSFREMILRTNDPTGSTTMTTLIDRSTETIDQPFVSATSTLDAVGIQLDRVFVGANNLGDRSSNGGDGRTAEVTLSNNAASATPAGFATHQIEARNTFQQDYPAIRTAIHNCGVVYAVYYNWMSGGGAPASHQCDVIVVRDDAFGTGATPFRALNDATDGNPGQRVVTNRTVPAFGATSLGHNRLVGSNLAIAVDPTNSATVYIGWCDRVSLIDYTLHISRSTDHGQTWSADLLTITNATNPGIAINSSGMVGVMYQQLPGLLGAANRWETHFRSTGSGGTSWTDDVLSTFLDSDLAASNWSPSLGDYLDIQAVGESFYGVFPAGNRAVSANFPHGVTYQRNVNWAGEALLGTNGITRIDVSVDPFFFRIAPTPRIIGYCLQHPDICSGWVIKTPYIIPKCLLIPCIQRIPIPELCKLIDCSGCGPAGMCPPYYHLFLEEFDPAPWQIQVVDKEGFPVKYEIHRLDRGVVVSFRPDKRSFFPERVPHYDLVMMSDTPREGTEFRIKARLETSSYRYREHLMYGRRQKAME
jgi:hypothetical protein